MQLKRLMLAVFQQHNFESILCREKFDELRKGDNSISLHVRFSVWDENLILFRRTNHSIVQDTFNFPESTNCDLKLSTNSTRIKENAEIITLLQYQYYY